jgi:pSer/pThr/pTyr-binding forkhead associated (FHA) protein
MVQLCILSGKKAGSQTVVRRFPFSIGRSAGSDLSLEDEGVWERHLTLEFQNQEQFVAQTVPGALLALNQQSVETAPLRNGDILTLGSVKLQFWLAPARQRGLKFRESLAWGLLAVVTLTQLALIYWLDY